MVTFEPTTTPVSQRMLANTLGYPDSWHVVRVVKDGSFFDTIYAGDPKTADTYYNHIAAMDAAIKWKEGESTPYDDNGGQMLPIPTFKLREGDTVEVYYEPDSAWYKAKITKVVQYKDDVRYSVRYIQDRSTQSNICIDVIRLIEGSATSKKSKQVTVAQKGTPAAEEKNAKRKGKVKDTTSESKKTSREEFIPSLEALEIASSLGFPEGWSASVKSGSRYTIISPDGSKRFQSKKAAYEYLGLPIPSSDKLHIGKGYEKTNDDDQDDDPPWRTSGSDYLGRRICYEFKKGKTATGSVTGWISATDVDSNGDPGYTSERTGKSAALYHVTFDQSSAIDSQDMEEFELLESLVEDEE